MDGWVILIAHDGQSVDELLLTGDGGFYSAPLGQGQVFTGRDAKKYLSQLQAMPGHGSRFVARRVRVPARETEVGLERKH